MRDAWEGQMGNRCLLSSPEPTLQGLGCGSAWWHLQCGFFASSMVVGHSLSCTHAGSVVVDRGVFLCCFIIMGNFSRRGTLDARSLGRDSFAASDAMFAG